MAAAGALTSDHVNLMVLRYLEEHGHEKAAGAFYRDWRRPPEHDDPETLPFAQDVHRNELVSVIQHGLVYDDLQARVRNNMRRFRWTESRHYTTATLETAWENGGDSRPASSSKRTGRPPSVRPHTDFSAPPPKRQRRSEGSEAHVNGDRDAMDIESGSPAVYGDEDGDATSAAVVSEPDVNELTERYDSMDVATQTELKVSVKTDATQWNIDDKPGVKILHSAWNPCADLPSSRTLLTVGESLCRFYQIPHPTDDPGEMSHTDQQSDPEEFYVSATAWRPDGYGAACAISGIADSHDNVSNYHVIIERNPEIDTAIELKSPLSETSGTVLNVQYSPDSNYLLAAQTTSTRGWIHVWHTARSSPTSTSLSLEPVAWCGFASQVLDIAWTGEDTFLVCGEDGLSELYEMDPTQQTDGDSVPSEDSRMRGLRLRHTGLLNANGVWDKVRFDHSNEVAVIASTTTQQLRLIPLGLLDAGEAASRSIELPGVLTALAFQPYQGSGSGARTILAATFRNTGKCAIYSVSIDTERRLRVDEMASLSLSDGPALALAWSPSGEYVAVSSTDLVQIWRLGNLDRGTIDSDTSVTWRLSSDENEITDGYEEKAFYEPCLSWSADGDSLAFAIDDQIAIIRCKPSLLPELEENHLNGTP